MKGYNSPATLLIVLAALMAHSPAQASKTPEIQRAAPDNVLTERAALQARLDRAARSIGPAPRDVRMAQWYNSRFSNRGFSNW